MFCKACHYSLRDLAEPRCPECGVDFDPANPDTFLVTVEPTWKPWLRLAAAYGLLFVLALIHCVDKPFPWLWTPPFVPEVLAQATYYWVVLLALWHAVPSIEQQILRWDYRRWWPKVVVLGVVLAVVVGMIYVTRETSGPMTTMIRQLVRGALLALGGVFLVQHLTQWLGFRRDP